MSVRVLILDGDSNAGCAVLQSLGRAGYECWLAAPSTGHAAFASRYVAAAVVYPDPLVDKEAFQRWLIDFQQARRFALIVPPTECTLFPLHEVRAEPALAAALALPPAEAVEIATDKERTRVLAESLGVPSPESLLVRTAPELGDRRIDAWLAAEGAVVLKSVRSKIWRGGRAVQHPVRVVRDRPELGHRAAEMVADAPVQVQRWVPGRGIGIDLLAAGGRIVMSHAHERLHELPLTGGASTYRRTIAEPPELRGAAGALMSATAWHGVAMVEFRVDDDTGRFWLMEINGRFWGSLPLSVFAGADFPRALAELLLHGRLPAGPVPRPGRYARKVTLDLDWHEAVLRRRLRQRGGADPLVTRHPLARSLVEWSRLLTGVEAWDGARFDDPGPFLREVVGYASNQVDRLRRLTRKRGARRLTRRRLARLGDARRVLVLCSGNICRSPYAAQRLAALAPRGVEVRQGGLDTAGGRGTPDGFLRLAAARGTDLAAHRSRSATADDLAWADLIVIMDDRNHQALAVHGRAALAKAIWLGGLTDGGSAEIQDPIDEPDDETARILARIDGALARLAEALAR